MNRRRWPWLVSALALLMLSLLLVRISQDAPPPPPRRKVDFSVLDLARSGAQARMINRRTYVPPGDTAADAGAPAAPRDPVLEALPRGQDRTAVVVEANALRHSPLGELLLECLLSSHRRREELEDFRQHTGVDPLEDLDRVAFMDDGLVLSGHFSDVRLEGLMPGHVPTPHGHQGRIYQPAPAANGQPPRDPGLALGTWGEQLVVFAQTPEAVRQILDRLEGRGPQEPPVLSGGMTVGDMYGVVSVERLASFLPPEQRALGERLKGLARQAELQLDVSSDFILHARLQGKDRQQTLDLAKTLGATLSLARAQALDSDQAELAQFLEYARATADGEKLSLQLALPLEALRQELAWCRGEAGSPEER